MGKRWTEFEESVMREHYEIAKMIEHVAEMLGRPKYSVIKKGLSMGLKRPDFHQESINRLKSVLTDEPMDSAFIASALDITRNAANDLLRRLSSEGICHIVGWRKNGGRSKDTPLWKAGKAPVLPVKKTPKPKRAHKTDEDVEKAKDAEYRDHKCIWWPKMTHDLEEAFRAMVRCGQAEHYEEAA
jgi:hypothetical protein